MLNYSKKLIGYNRIFSDLVSIDNLGKLPQEYYYQDLKVLEKLLLLFIL